MKTLIAMFWTFLRWDMYAAELGPALKENCDARE